MTKPTKADYSAAREVANGLWPGEGVTSQNADIIAQALATARDEEREECLADIWAVSEEDREGEFGSSVLSIISQCVRRIRARGGAA